MKQLTLGAVQTKLMTTKESDLPNSYKMWLSVNMGCDRHQPSGLAWVGDYTNHLDNSPIVCTHRIISAIFIPTLGGCDLLTVDVFI